MKSAMFFFKILSQNLFFLKFVYWRTVLLKLEINILFPRIRVGAFGFILPSIFFLHSRNEVAMRRPKNVSLSEISLI